MTIDKVPYLLIIFRFAVGPLVLFLVASLGAEARYACVGLLSLGVLSDIFDGVIARRIGCATPELRTLDSRADVVFWICILLSVLVLCPGPRLSLIFMGLILFAIEFIAPIASFIRFRREASTHHRLSKIFGLGLWALMATLFIHGSADRLQWIVFALGVVSQIEAIAIMLVIPEWQTDIVSIRYAFRLRAKARANP